MAQKDSKNQVNEAVAFNIQTISTDTTTSGTIIDTLGKESVLFLIHAGTVSAGDVTPIVQDGDDSALSDAASVDDKWLLGTEALAALDTSNTASRIGYVGKKRYVRLNLLSDNSANLIVGATCVLSDAISNPTS